MAAATTELEKPDTPTIQQQQQEPKFDEQKVRLEQTAILQREYDRRVKLEQEKKRRERKVDESKIKILLMGARHLGSHIVHALKDHATFVVVDRQDPEYIFANPLCKQDVPRRIVRGFQISELDLFHNLTKLLEREEFDFVINTMSVHDAGFSQTNPTYTSWVNTVYTQQMMNALIEAKSINPNIKIMHMSSDKIYGNNGCPPGQNIIQEGDLDIEGYWPQFMIDETEEPNPLGVKAISRYNQEIIVRQMCKTHGIDYMILRLGNLWGRYTTQVNMLNNMLVSALKTKIIHVYGDKWASRHLLNIEDLSEFVCDLLVKKYDKANWNEVYNVGGFYPTRHYVYGFAKFIQTMLSGQVHEKIDPKGKFVLPFLSVKIQYDPPRFYEDSEEAGIRIWMNTGKDSKLDKLGYVGKRDIVWDQYFKELLQWDAAYFAGYNLDEIQEKVRSKITY